MPVRCSVQMSGGPRKSGHVKWSSDGYSLLPPSLNLENDVYICCHHTVKIIVYVPFFRIKSFMQHCVAQRHEYGASSFVFNPRDRCKNQINTTRHAVNLFTGVLAHYQVALYSLSDRFRPKWRCGCVIHKRKRRRRKKREEKDKYSKWIQQSNILHPTPLTI